MRARIEFINNSIQIVTSAKRFIVLEHSSANKSFVIRFSAPFHSAIISSYHLFIYCNVKADNNQLILMTINGFVCNAVDLVNGPNVQLKCNSI